MHSLLTWADRATTYLDLGIHREKVPRLSTKGTLSGNIVKIRGFFSTLIGPLHRRGIGGKTVVNL